MSPVELTMLHLLDAVSLLVQDLTDTQPEADAASSRPERLEKQSILAPSLKGRALAGPR